MIASAHEAPDKSASTKAFIAASNAADSRPLLIASLIDSSTAILISFVIESSKVSPTISLVPDLMDLNLSVPKDASKSE